MRSPLSWRLGRLASEALIAEAALFPKPGLVTPRSSGSHADMDYPMFVASALALETCFVACACAGEVAGAAPSSPDLLTTLRSIGQEGEKAMFRVTGGVNTHKGALFCLGLLTAAMACAHAQGFGPDRQGDAACGIVAGLCAGLVTRELSRRSTSESLTAGERLYLEQGVRGARGQAEDGYPLLRDAILPLLRKASLGGGTRFDQACVDALLLSMSKLEDSCLLARGGTSGLAMAQQGAKAILGLGGADSGSGRQALGEFDRVLVGAGLSPGGSADMVAAGIFLVKAESLLASKGMIRIA